MAWPLCIGCQINRSTHKVETKMVGTKKTVWLFYCDECSPEVGNEV